MRARRMALLVILVASQTPRESVLNDIYDIYRNTGRSFFFCLRTRRVLAI